MADPPDTRAFWRGILVTLGAIVLAEVARDVGGSVAALLSVTILIGALAAVAYAAYVSGRVGGLASAALLAVYTAHYSSKSLVVDLTLEAFQGFAIMAIIGAVVALVVGTLKARTDALAEVALRQEREYAEGLRRANAQLTQANEALEAFSYLVTHDLKEPVRSTDMLLEFLEQDHGSDMAPDARDLLSRARRANERLAKLLASLLDLSRASRIDSRDAHAVDLDAALRSDEGVIHYRDLAEREGAKVELDLQGAPRIDATAGSVAQIFGNLIANAIRHNASPDRRVRVRALPATDGFVAIVVDDNGPGFPPGLVERFEKAESLPSSTRDGGFGLIIARRAVARLHGRMTLERAPELGGARVRVELPRSAEK